jgi:amphi-Trp domain-containing protein
MSKSSISLHGSMDTASLAKLLEDVAGSVKAGTVCLQKGGEFVTLKPAGIMDFKVEAEIKKGKQKFEISVKWEAPQEIAAPGDIRISSEEPEVPCPAEEEAAPGETAPAGEAAGEVLGVETCAEPCAQKKGKKKGKAQDAQQFAVGSVEPQ